MSAPSEGLPVPEGAYEASDAHLKQQIGLFGLIALAVSVQIGSGWLLATLAAASIAGPASILTWILGAVFFAIIGVTWMELGAMLPRSGAGVRYPRLTHGAFLSWFNGWGYFIAALALPVIEAQAVLTYVGGHWPELGFLEVVDGTTVLSTTGTIVGFVLLFVFFLLNSFGAKLLSESNKYVTIWKLVIPTITALLMFTAFSSSNFTIGGGFAPLGGGAVLGALATRWHRLRVLGPSADLDFGGEVVNPQRNIPIAIVVGGILIPLVIYVMLQIGFVGAIDWSDAGVQAGDWAGLKGSDWASSPLLNAVTAAGFAWFATVLLTDAVLSPAATGWVWLGIGTRTVYSMSVNNELPKGFQRINRYGTPLLALTACTVLGLLFFFPAPSWYLFVGMVSIALTLSYVMGGPVLAVLRRTAPDFPRPVRLRAATFWAMLGYVASLLLIYFAGWFSLINLFTVVFFALPSTALTPASGAGGAGPARAGRSPRCSRSAGSSSRPAAAGWPRSIRSSRRAAGRSACTSRRSWRSSSGSWRRSTPSAPTTVGDTSAAERGWSSRSSGSCSSPTSATTGRSTTRRSTARST